MRPAQRRNLRARRAREQNNRCALCLEPFTDDDPPTLDHIKPRAKGGRDHVENLQAAHRRCNGSRGDQDLTEHRCDRLLQEIRRALSNL